jgi:hypothetical protein
MSMPTPLNHHVPTEKGRVLIISFQSALLPLASNAYLALMKERRNLLRLEAKK